MTQAISTAAFREALAQFASGVTVVATRGRMGLVGFTATGFSSVSLDPPLILVSIGKDASAYDGIVAAETFGVSILDEGQAAVAKQFARSGVDRFAGVTLAADATSGTPLVEGAIAHLECRRYALHDAGDHTLVVGEVLAARVRPGRPLLHYARAFGAFLAS
jgi:flavin reductase (DIM6/NTAB) family NADH-FMN oxidoreductase RutF